MTCRKLPALLVLCALFVGVEYAWSSEKLDHDRARQAVQAGRAQALHAVLASIARDFPGQVLEVELEEKEGRLVYEIKILQAGGQLLKLYVDARTLEVLQSSRRSRDKRS